MHTNMNTGTPSNPSAGRPTRRQFMTRTATAVAGVAALGTGLRAATAEAPRRHPGFLGGPLESDRKIRIGIVGGGFGAAFHWHQHPNCTVQAVSDLIPERRELLMKVYNCDRPYDSLEELIQDDSIEAVAVFTGAPDHVRHCTAVMETGKHAISAVPACMSLEEAEQLLDVQKRTGMRYMMAETSAFQPHTLAAREFYEQGHFGDLFLSEVEYSHPLGWQNPQGRADRNSFWFEGGKPGGKPTWRNGYVPMLYPTHGTGFTVFVTGERFKKVSCFGYGEPGDEVLTGGANPYNNPYSTQVALMNTDAGHICRNKVVYSGTVGAERADLYGTLLTVTTGCAGLDQPFKIQGPNAEKCQPMKDYHQLLPESLRVESGHGGSHVFITHEFIASLIENRPALVDIYEALAMTVCGVVANQSALRGGELLDIPDYGRAST